MTSMPVSSLDTNGPKLSRSWPQSLLPRADGAAAIVLGLVVVTLVAATLVWATRYKASADWDAALANYRAQADQVTHDAITTIDGKLRHIRQGLRTIGLLPSVRAIDRRGENIDATAKESIQQLYNNMKENVEVSEIYIVPVNLEPDKIDPVTGKPEEPILMFDELIVNAADKARAAGTLETTTEDEPEVEIYEYRALQQQMAWLKINHPTDSEFLGIERPMLSSAEVITCDNTLYIHSHTDGDRTGIILSVPFYGPDGILKGSVSAIIRSKMLASYLPARNFALLNTAHNYRVLSETPGVERQAGAFIDQLQPDPNLIYSKIMKVPEADAQGEWLVWSGLPDEQFLSGSDANAVRNFEKFAYSVIVLLVLMGGAALMFLRYQLHVTEGLRAKQNELDDMLAKLMVARDEARAGSQAKSDFLASMSHEIRTPLNGVLGMAQSLLAADISSSERKKVSVIIESGNSLLMVLNDVLDYSKIEAGKLEISPIPGDLVRTIARIIQFFDVQAREKGIDLREVFDPNIPDQLVYDAVRVRQCLSNLISNAVKFTQNGVVTVSASTKPLGGNEHMVQFEVTDTGMGMSSKAQANLFTPFMQADTTITRRFGGTGLGLAVSRQLARLMGGDIVVDSTEGKGSRFTLTFRAKAVAREQGTMTILKANMTPRIPMTLRGKRILLTDDVPINRQVIKLFLLPQGCEITEAVNGQDALDRLATETFDIVLLDVHMPVMDGKEAIRRIRSSPEPWSTIPVIALTADAMAGSREALLAMGMTEYLSKPLDQRELVAKINLVLHQETLSGRKAASGT